MYTTNSSETKETSPNLAKHSPRATDTTLPMETTQNLTVDENTLRTMLKMGYKSETEIDTNREGTFELIHATISAESLNFKHPQLENDNFCWDFSLETVNVREELKWIANVNCCWSPKTCSWIIKGPIKLNIDDETHFCDPVLLQNILSAKGVFDELDQIELCKARSRANPFETIRSAFFMNRAALKMANIDAVSGFIFTEIDRNPRHSKQKGPYYFADVCAGPGGFSEYILWRKKWLFKGFGFTLKGTHDFKLNESQCASPATFGALYGLHENGDVCCPENIEDFARKVLHETDGCGVHFMMSDGGFSVEGNENLQEILSKQLYVCQCLMALEIVRPHGHFVTKLFDVFTPFSVGLIFLMYNCFERIAILKPNTSRPANSERYLVCYGLKLCPQTLEIRTYLTTIAHELWQLRQIQNDLSFDVREIVPMSVIKADREFYTYIMESNNRIGAKQTVALLKLGAFCRNPNLIESRQEQLRIECLKYWRIPDRPKVPLPKLTTDDLLTLAVQNPDFMIAPSRRPKDVKQLTKLIENIDAWRYVLLGSKQNATLCNFYAGVGGSRVYRLQNYKWVKVKRLELVRGTLLFGEMVQEIRTGNNCAGEEHQESTPPLPPKQSLHVIDALRLGDIGLADLSFAERLALIETYCEAVNHESRKDNVRIRAKRSYTLRLAAEPGLGALVTSGENLYCPLPILSLDSFHECYQVNFVLFLRTDEDTAFKSAFPSRIELLLKDENGTTVMEALVDHVKKISN